jgi:hypothetical protein
LQVLVAALVEADVNGPTEPERLATTRVGTWLTKESNDNVSNRILPMESEENKLSVRMKQKKESHEGEELLSRARSCMYLNLKRLP